jgi:hypothetical protein
MTEKLEGLFGYTAYDIPEPEAALAKEEPELIARHSDNRKAVNVAHDGRSLRS